MCQQVPENAGKKMVSLGEMLRKGHKMDTALERLEVLDTDLVH